jgi:hypothetical protein
MMWDNVTTTGTDKRLSGESPETTSAQDAGFGLAETPAQTIESLMRVPRIKGAKRDILCIGLLQSIGLAGGPKF